MNTTVVTGAKSVLSWYDYGLIVLMLLISTITGIYYSYFDHRPKTINEYLFANKALKPLPIALSIAVGHVSAIALTAIPADVYRYGTYSFHVIFGLIIMTILAKYIYFPVILNLEMTSVYEYIELRFDKKTRILITLLYIISELLVLAVVSYVPSLALSVVTNVKASVISLIVSGICILYTTIGGLRTVVWTDFFQLFVMVVVIFVVCIVGTIAATSSIWQRAFEGGRFSIFDFTAPMTKRDSFWGMLVNFTVHFFNYMCLHQSGVQKFMALPKTSDCLKSLVYIAICITLFYWSATYIGILLYERYWNCDPLLINKIYKNEGLVPFYIAELTKNMPGLTGAYLVALFCASLSTISSSLNALSGVIFKDYFPQHLKEKVNERNALVILKLIVVVCGVISLALIFLIEHLGAILPLTTNAIALASGPSMGIFTLGVLFPQANANGAFYGSIGGFIFIGILVVPLKIHQFQGKFTYPTLPVSTEGCPSLYNISTISNVNQTQSFPNELPSILQISHLYHTLLGGICTILLGLLISYLTNKNRIPIDRELLSPVIHRFLPIEIPHSVGRKKFRDNHERFSEEMLMESFRS